MVSLIELKSDYLKDLIVKDEISEFVKFLFEYDLKIEQVHSPNNVPDIKKQTILSLINNDSLNFKSFYSAFERRNPDNQTNWIYDNVFLFLLICAVKKFSLEVFWLKKVLLIPTNLGQDESSKIRTTFINILNGNYDSPDNIGSIVVVFLHITGISDLKQVHSNNTYQSLNQKLFPFSNIDFLNIIGLKAIDIIILKKDLSNPEVTKKLESFHGKFLQRTEKTAKWIVNILLLSTVCLAIYFFYKYNNASEDNKKWFDLSFSVLSFAGTSLMTVFDNRKKLIEWIMIRLRSLWGY
ncbi:MAG: hypothetical protein J7604_18690 [Sporocytophaga sp.]|uniref:hypothetical protein n=1 Tax=Sporocytophaga sp. TaxID=2231183 RepID=UPI001B0A7A58|nr:hypothetical protein [Sporocytophaga sp.]MBO9702244.1 hypothetical protein [Sporocytophaga sp.]